MAIKLPTFEKSYGLIMTVCGKLKQASSQTKKGRDQKPKVARFSTPAGNAFIRVWVTGKPVSHLHVDCALQKFFPKDRIPKVTHKKVDVLKVIKRVIGLQIDVNIRACFGVPITELPEGGIVRALSVEQKTNDMSVKLTGGSLAVTGAPVSRVQWRIAKDNAKTVVEIQMEGETSSTISENYLQESWQWINNQFSLFVLGRRKGGRT
jgi:hypothetical protein